MGIFIALKAIHSNLHLISNLSRTNTEPKRFGVCTVSQETEDSRQDSTGLVESESFAKWHIQRRFDEMLQYTLLTCPTCAVIHPESLKILAAGNNYEIRQAATRILVDRFLSVPSEFESLSADLYSSDLAVRDMARRTVKVIEKYADPIHGKKVDSLRRQAGLTTEDPRAIRSSLTNVDETNPDEGWSVFNQQHTNSTYELLPPPVIMADEEAFRASLASLRAQFLQASEANAKRMNAAHARRQLLGTASNPPSAPASPRSVVADPVQEVGVRDPVPGPTSSNDELEDDPIIEGPLWDCDDEDDTLTPGTDSSDQATEFELTDIRQIGAHPSQEPQGGGPRKRALKSKL